MSSGLIASQQTRPNTTDSYYVRKGEPIESPLNIESLDGTKEGEIVITNDGDMGIYPAGGGNTVFIGLNNVSFCDLSATPVVEIGTGNGRVYDTVYNPVASINASTFTSPAIPVSTNQLIGTGALPAGLYMLQAKVNIIDNTTPYVAGTAINCYVEDLPSAPPTTYLPYSSILITAGTLIDPSGSLGSDVDATFTSAIFSIPAGKTNLKYVVEVDGSWNFGSGNLQLQLVKIG
jgi:hypothetical protein